MNLLPDLNRSPSLSTREPIACVSHNWLAERRSIFPLLQKVYWPEFTISKEMIPQSRKTSSSAILGLTEAEMHIEKFLELPRLKHKTAAATIQEYSGLKSSFWQTSISMLQPSSLTRLEQLFYLKRGQKETPCWWLYDAKYSGLMNHIRLQIAYAEQISFATQAIKSIR